MVSVLVRMERLYWVDALLDQIGLIGIDGNDRQTFTNIGQITQPYSLTIHSGRIHCVSICVCVFLYVCL